MFKFQTQQTDNNDIVFIKKEEYNFQKIFFEHECMCINLNVIALNLLY